MSVKKKLRTLCDEADKNAEKEWKKALDDIRQVVGEELRGDIRRAGIIRAASEKRIEHAASAIRDATAALDAADEVRDVLRAPQTVVRDIRASRDIHLTQSRIYDLFLERRVPRRGFVYLVWSARPEHFFYVGKAKSRERLNLRNRGYIAHALANGATRVSVVFPPGTSDRRRSQLEACVLRVIQERTGTLPEHNSRLERLPAGDNSECRRQLSDMFHLVGTALERAPKRGKSAIPAPSI